MTMLNAHTPLGVHYTALVTDRAMEAGIIPSPARADLHAQDPKPPPMIEQCDARPSISCHPDSGGPTAQTWVEVWVGLELWLTV